MNNIDIPRYVKLVSPDHISMEDARLWYKTVLDTAPQGVLSSIDMVGLGGKPASYRMVRRNEDGETSLIVPITRDLLPDEVETITRKWTEVCPSGKYSVRSNSSQADRLQDKVADITMPHDEYMGLCSELAKRQHENWMKDKVEMGWRYGPTISVVNKTHPMLRPWADLPDQYKNVDTGSPENFLNFLNNQGYAVVRKEELGSLIQLLRNIR
jgi:hypothetical protein